MRSGVTEARTQSDPRLREAVNAVILGRMALITLVAAMAVAFSDSGLSLTRHYPFAFLVALSAGLAIAYHVASKGGADVRALLTTQLLVDVAVISYLLLFTGGTSSQFAPLYLLAPLMGGIFLTVRGGLLFAAASAAAYVAFYIAERAGLVPPMAYGLTERLSESALRLRLILYLPLLFVVGAIGGAIGRSLDEGRVALDEARAQLNRALFDTETILENLSSGLATIDSSGAVRHWNRAAGEIFGLTGESVQGRHYLESFGPGFEEFATRLRDALERGAEGTRYEAVSSSPRAPGISTAVNDPPSASFAAWATASSVADCERCSDSAEAIPYNPRWTRAWRTLCSKLAALRTASDARPAKVSSRLRSSSPKRRSGSRVATPRTPRRSPDQVICAEVALANPW
jgi:PAS domain-containing protein